MKIVFISNYYNHHQAAVCEALYRETGGGFVFLATEKMGEHRVKMGWQSLALPPFVIEAQGDRIAEHRELINTAEVVILGHAHPSLVVERVRAGRLTLRFAERVYRKRREYLKLPLHLYKNKKYLLNSENYRLLAASAYAPADYALARAFDGRALKWGYFPPLRRYEDIDGLIAGKERGSILWVGRMMGLKHPEAAIEVARRLKGEGREFHLRMIGVGKMQGKIEKMIAKYGLTDSVELLGAMSPDEVRGYMERSEIFLFTSDRNEGWGAVLNEAMNSACAVVASHAIGAVPFLMNGTNGCVYPSGNTRRLFGAVVFLLDNPERRHAVARAAYATILHGWCADVAASRLVEHCSRLLAGKEPIPYRDGVLTPAKKIRDNWL